MEDTKFKIMSETVNVKDELIVELKKKKRPKFKAGSELASSVNRMVVDWDNDLDEDENLETLSISIHLTSEPGED
jgi:hypothetical protein